MKKKSFKEKLAESLNLGKEEKRDTSGLKTIVKLSPTIKKNIKNGKTAT